MLLSCFKDLALDSLDECLKFTHEHLVVLVGLLQALDTLQGLMEVLYDVAADHAVTDLSAWCKREQDHEGLLDDVVHEVVRLLARLVVQVALDGCDVRAGLFNLEAAHVELLTRLDGTNELESGKNLLCTEGALCYRRQQLEQI